MGVAHTNIRVLVMGNFPYPHGMAGTKRIQHFIDGMLSVGMEVSVLTLRQDTPHANGEVQDYRGINYQNIGNGLKGDRRVVGRAIRYVKDGYRVLRQFQGEGKNILFYYGALNVDNLLFIRKARRLGYRIILDIVEDYQVNNQSVSTARRLNLAIMNSLDHWNLKWADGLVVISRHLQEKYASWNRWHKPIKLIPISAVLNGQLTKTRLMEAPQRVVYAGSYAAKDGVELLIEAVQRVRHQFDVQLELLGKGRRAAQYREQYGHLAGIHFLGYLEDDAFYRKLHAADILVVPRTDDAFAHAGFPFKLGEYLATGNPVVASQTGDVPFYLQSGEDAILVPPGDVGALAMAIRQLIEDPCLARQIGRNGQAACRQHFDTVKNNQKLIDLFHQI